MTDEEIDAYLDAPYSMTEADCLFAVWFWEWMKDWEAAQARDNQEEDSKLASCIMRFWGDS